MTEAKDPIHTHARGMPQLLELMRRLRDRYTGCPWDIEQTFETIAHYTIEDAYEVADAIEKADFSALKGELGDLLLQVVYHGQMADEAGHFSFDDVAKAITDKMIERHPHVFGTESRDKTAEDQTRDWEKVKAAERAQTGANGVLDDVALGLPALLRALKLQKRAARVGFDWTDIDDVIAKLNEEIAELQDARAQADDDAIEEEFGDLLFVMVNVARHMKIDPEAALRRANTKFVSRFQYIETQLEKSGRSPQDSSLEEMDKLWEQAKIQSKDVRK
ncbi:MAG: nucleoside triphosphate pyrophosphohydrolase [Boseongicola sp.]|nr:nucleoside triphosphate pyrophosphohydrolase [Boseongicola sp.]